MMRAFIISSLVHEELHLVAVPHTNTNTDTTTNNNNNNNNVNNTNNNQYLIAHAYY